jgi:NTE family protein
MKQRLGLVLSGGGARAAYQAGGLRALAEMSTLRELPFPVLAGASAGAINAAYLACHADNFQEATKKLWKMWETLSVDQIFSVNRRMGLRIGARWIADVALHRLPLSGASKPQYLLETDPFMELLSSNLDFNAIKTHIRSGKLHGVAFTATNYSTGTVMTFFDGHSSISSWLRRTRLGIRDNLTADHVAASTAIPIFFPPVLMKGSYYGDGCIRMTAPLSPAIHMGADRILAIGIHTTRKPKEAFEIANGNLSVDPDVKPSIADIFGVLMSAVFMEALEFDLERLQRINETLRLTSKSGQRDRSGKLRNITALALQPERDLGKFATGLNLPLPFHHLLFALGAASYESNDILSFLAFEKKYTSKLLELGYHDAMSKKTELLNFLSEV